MPAAFDLEGSDRGSASSSQRHMAKSASSPNMHMLVSSNSPILQNMGATCIYARSNATYGSRVPKLRPPQFGLSNRFSQKVAEAGMPQTTGLKTNTEDHSRYLRGTMDWAQKISM
mmetsp:Transcript_25971/g.86486  ORF Transcript_25971/g.86486 Transcript_25971/m.86486 type:complete len:115 (-) Transcript_25971:183-527(-)